MVLFSRLQVVKRGEKMMTNRYVIEGMGFNKNGEFVPMSLTTTEPMKLTGKLAIEKVTSNDTGEILYEREVDKLPFGNWWKDEYLPLKKRDT